jgi:hypothetical protein
MQPALVGLKHHIRVALGRPMDDESIPVISDIEFNLTKEKESMLVIAFLENHVSLLNPSKSATSLIGRLPPLLFSIIG